MKAELGEISLNKWMKYEWSWMIGMKLNEYWIQLQKPEWNSVNAAWAINLIEAELNKPEKNERIN